MTLKNIKLKILRNKISIVLLLSISLISCISVSHAQSCFKINGKSQFIVGATLDITKLKIRYMLSEMGKNVNKHNGFTDYESSDNQLSIENSIGGVSFTKADKSNKLISLTCFWMFMRGDNENSRKNLLNEIKTKFLNCLDLNKIDVKNGGQYINNINGKTETFALMPRIRENGIDVNYWSFYYTVK